MFKLESYITPILISYVNKYINNFKLEDSQVSLWGGEASFQNLELNLQVLEQELQLPFSFVSGSIRELLIHVPWTKLASEPITITINTIECILNLKGTDSGTRPDNSSKSKEKPKKPQQQGNKVDPPQGYVQHLINKIVSNIKIKCNNVILKYVEEDIVLSMNIKLLTFEAANKNWAPAYTDVSHVEVILRKIITVNDLTLCLDKRNASGKIEVYQEPMLYRCSMTMHLLRQYFTATARKASTTRLDIYCNHMEFSMTEQQVPMLMRLLMLLYALQQKQLRPEKEIAADGSSAVADPNDNLESGETWTGWAWSYVSSVLPAPWDEQDGTQVQIQKGHTMHFGFYVDKASVTFKVSETNAERGGYYAHKKMRYNPMLTFQLQGIYSDTVIHGLKWFNATGGISQAVLLPIGFCSCSHIEILNEKTSIKYLQIGSVTNSHKTDSLFDAKACENKGKRRQYNTSWDYHMTVFTESVLLERTPAFAYDYLYQMELPSDTASEILSDLGSDHEFSNLTETSNLRICIGPFKLRLCSGFLHRINTLEVAASYYDYPPYYILKPDLPLQDLLPPSEEDFDALNEFIPSRSIRITFFAPIIELELMDHPYFKPTKGNLFRKRKKVSTPSMSSGTTVNLPKLTIECQFLDISMSFPMYVNRLVHTTCQLPNPPKKLFDACFTRHTIKIMSLTSRLILGLKSQTTILTPSSISYSCNSILKPRYWTDSNISHIETVFESESITINGTNAKMMVVAYIIGKIIKLDSENAVDTMSNTSILRDARKDSEFPYMEFCIETVHFKKVITNSTISIEMYLGSIKSFIFESLEKKVKKGATKDIQQILFLSGPDPKPVVKHSSTNTKARGGVIKEAPLFMATIQYPVSPEVQKHPPIILFNLQEIRICIDPLLCKWLLYTPKQFQIKTVNDQHSFKVKNIPDKNSNITETPRKLGSQLESIHSSSDREPQHIPKKVEIQGIEDNVDVQERIYNILKKWFDVWKGMYLYGDISQCTIYFPLISLSAVGSQGIQEAVESAVNKDYPPDIMVITLPFANVRSAQRLSITKYLKILPVTLPETIWSPNKSSFPWTISISDLSCYTIQYGNKLTFLKPVSLSATVGLSTRPSKVDSSEDIQSTKSDITSLGVCVHIDMTPIVVSTSEVQIYLFASILYGLMEVSTIWFPENSKHPPPKTPDVLPPIITKGSSTLSPTILQENTVDSTSEKTPVNTMASTNVESDSVKLTAWIQWTVARFTIELLSSENRIPSDEDIESLQPRLKLVVDAEDIVSSLDFQSVYLKIKSKIGSVSIHHYKRSTPYSNWEPGTFSGVVMRLREDLPSAQRHEDNSFVSVTITRASCQHTHTLWGAVQKKNKDSKKVDIVTQQLLSQNRYITEIVVNVQPIDFVFSLKTLRSFYLVVVPLLQIPVNDGSKSVSSSNRNFLTNQNLPLAYLECQDIRIIIPSKDIIESGTLHDMLVLQVQKICLSPSAVNPICRTPLRPDIYEQAAHARILNIPGSEVEDRQYQLDLVGIYICTGNWSDIDSVFSQTGNKASFLRSKSENPALEWNNLDQGQPNVFPALNFWPITEKFDISVIAAPAMVYKENTVVCGHSVEINFVTDILINLSLNQIKLFSYLLGELLLLIEPLGFEENTSRTKITFPYSKFENLNEDFYEFETSEFMRDSGIDTSDIRSLQSSKAIKSIPESSTSKPLYYNRVPFDVLFAAGKITLSLYQVDDTKLSATRSKSKKKKLVKFPIDDLGYEAEEEFDDDSDYKKYIPLIYLGIKQPNVFISKQQFGQRIQISCFDLNFKLGPVYQLVSQIPVEDDYSTSILETKSGIPDPSTGILPAFFTLKYSKGVGKNATLDIEILKPTKILCCMSKWTYMLLIKNKVLETFRSNQKNVVLVSKNIEIIPENSNIGSNFSVSQPSNNYNTYQNFKDLLKGINVVNLNCNQIIFSIRSDSNHEVNLGTEKFKSQLSLSTRPEKLNLVCSLNCITLSIIKENFKKVLLNPWTISFDISLFWEAWQSPNSNPQIQIMAESDCIIIDISPQHIASLEVVTKEITEFMSALPSTEQVDSASEMIMKKSLEKDQHYKDDLRAGAFQFVDASNENAVELPLPYQVMFWNNHISAMAWRYPQPRALTKIRVFPVPYKTSHDDLQVLCHLEYWSDLRNCYLPFTQFYLSESEVCHLSLPEHPRPIVASTWRVVIHTVNDKEDNQDNMLISPRALAACMRIDSYFNKSLIPDLTTALYLTKIEVALHNYFDRNSPVKFPDCLKDFTPDYMFPDNQRFLILSLDNMTVFLSSWNFNMLSMELTSSVKLNVLDYSFLTEQTLIGPFTSKLEVDVSDTVLCNFISKPIEIRFGPSIAHTLAVSSQIWHQNHTRTDSEKDFIIMTRYVICNDSNVSIRIGQNNTDESILLPSRHFHLYSWRSQKKKQQLKIALEEHDWIWSKPFDVSTEKTQVVHFEMEKTLVILVTVKSLSASQKKITISGQLIVSNMLMEHFEMKIIEADTENKELEFKNAQSYIVPGKCNTPSVFINNTKKYFLRLRFYGLESAWTGDIPLREHNSGSQPWLVKVPLQERGQFLSIWCRIVTRDLHKVRRILAMLWPLFTVRSNLPFNSKVHIETPTLNVHLDSVVNGKGELQQLYCPGTIDHSHQLTFKIDKNDPKSNPYVPLNYSLVDHNTFFKKSEKEDIEEILEVLRTCSESKWPYLDNDLKDIEWVVDERPLTHVQVRYQNSCQYSSSLLVELLPWSLTINTLGVPITLMSSNIELCRIQHNGIIAPPKLEENFHIGICAGGVWCYSDPLQLSKSEWSQSFYMPKITGNIPLEGTIKTPVKFDTHICMLSITSIISNEIRLLKISSTHVISNYIQMQLQVICFAVPESDDIYSFPENTEPYSFTVPPHLQKNQLGISIIQWHTLNIFKDSISDYALYMAFSMQPKLGWSCPIRVDKPFIRKPICVTSRDHPIPLVLTSQEYKGQTYIAVHYDERPQLLIENKTGTVLFCAQSTSDQNIVKETQHLKWNCKLPENGCIYYTMPFLSEKFPDLPQNNFSEKIVLACEPESTLEGFEWSSDINVTHDNEIFARVPYHGDIKVVIVNTACTTILTLESVSQVEISAKDIRVRLSMHESQKKITERHSEPSPSILKVQSLDVPRTLSDTAIPGPSRNYELDSQSSSQSTIRRWSDTNLINVSSLTRSLMVKTISMKEKWNMLQCNVFVASISLIFVSDLENEGREIWEVASLICDNIVLKVVQSEVMKISASICDIQLDNQLYLKESYDFPVLLIGQDKKKIKKLKSLNIPIQNLMKKSEGALFLIDCIFETWQDHSKVQRVTGVRAVKITLNPISCFIEDTYITKLMDYFNILLPNNLVIWPHRKFLPKSHIPVGCVNVPDLISWQCAILARPLTIRHIGVAPLSILLSVHSSIKLYIALDQSPLQFGKFERRRVFTTPYRLGHALTMHYLSGAIFGAGWVVSSLELLGSPGGLARAMGTGLRDFVSMPYRGLLAGPMAFLKGITQGSASLMKHVTAGTLQSVTKLASSVARNLDRLTLDEEHLKRTEEQRRQRPQGLAQGFMQGLTGLGISLLGALGGIAHHPLQSVMSHGASPSSLAAGVGLGIVGIVTKPLSGAADLVALTGQGLLQGAGWNTCPEPRTSASVFKVQQSMNSTLKYNWKHAHSISPNHFLYVVEVTSISANYQYQALALILTVEALIIINIDDDVTQRVISLSELNIVQNNDPTMLTFKLNPPLPKIKNEEEGAIEMDPISRARVADYVKSTVGLLNLPDNSPEHSDISISPLSSPGVVEKVSQESTILTYYINPQNKKHFLCLLALTKQQHLNYNFPVL